jgi:putative oxidoreductase
MSYSLIFDLSSNGNKMKRQLLFNICLGLLILLYSYTAVSKFLDQYRFVFQMKLSPFSLIKNFAPFLGVFIPLLEVGIVVGLSIEKIQKFALLTSLGLLLIFETYIVGMLMTGLKLPCACGGVIAFMSWPMHVLFNAFFITTNFIAIRKFKTSTLAINFP